MAGPVLAKTATRLSAWLRPPRPTAPAEVVPHVCVRRRIYDDIGDFLLAYDLELNEHNFAIARAYLSGDPKIGHRIDQLLRTPGALTDTAFAAIGRPGASGVEPDYVVDIARQLNLNLEECLRIVHASSTSGVAYRAVIESVETIAVSDPERAFTQMIALTHRVLDGTRVLEEQLEGARRETERLRGNLQRARRDADRDHLTGLPNRRVFERLLDAIPPDDAAVPHCVALCDIDDFKAINDQHGHETGDRVLRFIARFLRTALGREARLARYGGEEFACLFEGMNVHQARDMLDLARERLQARSIASRDDGTPIGHVTFSAGLVRITGDPRAAVRHADDALYQAKRSGKNQVAIGAQAHRPQAQAQAA